MLNEHSYIKKPKIPLPTLTHLQVPGQNLQKKNVLKKF
jgi:hypothetical protein